MQQTLSKGSMRFRVLGPLEVEVGDGPIPLGGPKQRAVLAHLLFRANQLVRAETLVDELWGEEPPERARNVIQTYISHLRKALGRDRIQSHGPGYRLTLDPSELDALRFADLMREAKKALPVDPDVAVATLEDALALWRGPALADLAGQSSLLSEAARLDELRLEAQEARIEGLLAAGAQAPAIGELEALVAGHPWRESLWGLLMLACYREGRQAEALRSYQRAREILAEELGIDPSPELVRLHERILKQDPGLDLRGEPLRGYRLLEKVGDGPTGVVFRALQPRVERDVAVKIFHEAIAADPEFVRRFERDALAVAALEHPHIAHIYDYWREPGRAYVVSRYLRGGSLRAIEERGEPLERDRALRVVEQISLALTFAHRQGLAHGNIGPSNIRRLRVRSRLASGAAVLVVLAGIAVPLWILVFSPPADVAGSARPATLVVHETAVATSLRGEGYYAYLALETTDGTRVRLVGQKGTAAEPLSLRVEPGSYRLISYQRSCNAACPRLDPERFGYCSTVVSVQSGEAVKLRLSVRPYEGCTISIGR